MVGLKLKGFVEQDLELKDKGVQERWEDILVSSLQIGHL